MAVAFYFAAKFDKAERCVALLARFSAVPSLTSLAPGRASARLFGMVNQLPTVYKALSGDDGKPGAAGAKKKVRLATRRSPGAPLGLASRRRARRPSDATASPRAGALRPAPRGAAAGVRRACAKRRRQARPPRPGGASAGGRRVTPRRRRRRRPPRQGAERPPPVRRAVLREAQPRPHPVAEGQPESAARSHHRGACCCSGGARAAPRAAAAAAAAAGATAAPGAASGARSPTAGVLCRLTTDSPNALARSCTGPMTGCGTAPRSCPSTRAAAAPRRVPETRNAARFSTSTSALHSCGGADACFSRDAQVLYSTGDVENLQLDEVINDGHLNVVRV